jgi:hypothetical protein
MDNLIKLVLAVVTFAIVPFGVNANTPSQNMITACADKEAGDVCEFQTDKGADLNGTCVMQSNQLFCQAYNLNN